MVQIIRTTVVVVIFCLSLPKVWAIDCSTDKDSLEKAKFYFERGLTFSSNKIIRSLLKVNRKSNDSLFTGDLYKWQAFNFYEQGLVTQYAAAIDSMWLYKQPFGKAYYIEYISMLLRLRALKHDYENIGHQLDSAEVVFRNLNDNEKEQIDTFFYKLNIENIYRNHWENGPKEQHQLDYNNIRLHRIFKLQEQFQKLPKGSLKPTYAIYIGNFFQDYLSKTTPADTFYNTTVFNACMSSYQWVIDWCKANGYSYSSFMARAYLLQSLQHMYRAEYAKAQERLLMMQKQIEIKLLNQSFFLGGVFPLHYYQHSYRAHKNASDYTCLKALLKYNDELHRLRFYYNEHYRSNRSELFINGYPPQAQKEEAELIFELLLQDSSNKALQERLWQNLSTYTHYEAFYHRVRLKIGVEKYDSLSTIIVNSSRHISEALEQYVILDSTQHAFLTEKLSRYKNEYDSLVSSNTHINQLIEGTTIYSLKEAQQRLKVDEARIHFLFPRFESDIKVCIVTQKSFNTILIKSDNQLDSLILEFARKNIEIQNDTLANARPYHELYKRIFQPCVPYLEGVKRLNILGLNNYFTLPLEQLVTNPVSTYYRKPKILAQKYAIRYTSNLAVNYMNTLYNTDGQNRIVQPSQEFLQQNPKYTPILFSNQLTSWLKEKFFIDRFVQTSEALFQTAEYNILHFSTHGVQNSKLRSHLSHNSQSAINENYILLDDTLISIESINKSRIKANLVVLGSCDLGHGLSQSVSGSYNFGRVFISNGSNAVIKSAYPIDDYSASFILKRFYTYLIDGEYASVALQHAKLDFIRQCSDITQLTPYYWASLILEGNDFKISSEPYYKTHTGILLLLTIVVLTLIYLIIRFTRNNAF